jgi:DHA1 family multidrug resistance protein-like MFS transporter
VLSLLTTRAFTGALLLTLVAQLAGTALLPVIPLFIQELIHNARGAAPATGWVMALSGVTAAAGSYVAGRLQRRVGLKPLIAASLALAVALLAPQAFAAGYVQFLLLRSASAFAFGALFGLVGVWAAVSSPKEAKGTAFGLMGAASSLGFGAGPLLGGALTGAVGLRPIFLLSALALAVLPVVSLGAVAALPAMRGGLVSRRRRVLTGRG